MEESKDSEESWGSVDVREQGLGGLELGLGEKGAGARLGER